MFFVIEVNEESFDQYVLLNAHKIPVFVEFMGVWSGPCISLDKVLNGQLTYASLAAKADDLEMLNARLLSNLNDYDVRFDRVIRLIAHYEYSETVENLFYIHKSDPEYKEGAAKEMIITVSNMITPVDYEFAQEIKRKLANFLSE